MSRALMRLLAERGNTAQCRSTARVGNLLPVLAHHILLLLCNAIMNFMQRSAWALAGPLDAVQEPGGGAAQHTPCWAAGACCL